MIVFFKAQFSSLIATVVDFTVTIIMIESIGLNYIFATTNGALAGAVTNFTLNKFWSFNQGLKEFKTQGLRYGLVWIGSIGLNVMGSNLLIPILKIPYVLSKLIVSVIVGIAFNYTLQKHYVFGNIKKTYKK